MRFSDIMRRAYVNLKMLERKAINVELKSAVLSTVDNCISPSACLLPPIT